MVGAPIRRGVAPFLPDRVGAALVAASGVQRCLARRPRKGLGRHAGGLGGGPGAVVGALRP
eukprot:7360275-Lingulodinium_polyedra.AAC.1